MSQYVHHGDALAIMAAMDSESVDAVVSDPPYSSGSPQASMSASAKSKYLRSDSRALDRLPEFYDVYRSGRGMAMWSALWMSEAWRLTKDGGAIAVFSDWRQMPIVSDALQAGGWIWRGVGVWNKPKGRSRPVRGGLWNSADFIVWGSKGARTGECITGSWTVGAPRSQVRQHPTEKPSAVLADLVLLAPPDGLILDPFAGSGSTGVAAVLSGRRFIGCELSGEYAQRANDRIEAAARMGAGMWRAESNLFTEDDAS